MAQAHDEQREAHPVGQKSHQHGSAQYRHGRKPVAHGHGQSQIHTSRHQPFHGGDPGRVVERHIAGKVVVNAPSKAGSENSKGWPKARKAYLVRPAQYHRPGRDGCHAQGDAPIKVLPKGNPRQKRREDAFGIEQEGRAGRRHASQPNHKQNRADNTASEGGPRKPFGLTRRQLHGGRPPRHSVNRQAKA